MCKIILTDATIFVCSSIFFTPNYFSRITFPLSYLQNPNYLSPSLLPNTISSKYFCCKFLYHVFCIFPSVQRGNVIPMAMRYIHLTHDNESFSSYPLHLSSFTRVTLPLHRALLTSSVQPMYSEESSIC